MMLMVTRNLFSDDRSQRVPLQDLQLRRGSQARHHRRPLEEEAQDHPHRLLCAVRVRSVTATNKSFSLILSMLNKIPLPQKPSGIRLILMSKSGISHLVSKAFPPIVEFLFSSSQRAGARGIENENPSRRHSSEFAYLTSALIFTKHFPRWSLLHPPGYSYYYMYISLLNVKLQSVFPLSRKVWKMTFWNVPSAGGLMLQQPTAHAGRWNIP